MSDFKLTFLKQYLAAGFGAMPKRDIDALVMHLVDEYGVSDGRPLKTLSNQQISVKLRVPVARVKSLRYEAMLKFKQDNINLAKWKFLEVLARAQFDAEKQKIGFVIEDSFTKHWVQGVLKDHGLVFDNSFNTEIVRVDVDAFCNVLALMYDKESVRALKKRMENAIAKNEKFSFAEAKKEFLKGAASGLGEAATSGTVKGLLLLTGLS